MTAGAILAFSLVTLPHITLETFNIQRLERFAHRPGVDESLTIAVIGTSLTQNAFYKDEDMEKLAETQGRSIRFLRFTLNAGMLPDYHDLLKALIEAKTDLICIESALFTINFRGQSLYHYVLERHRSYMRKCIKRVLRKIPVIGTQYYLPTEFGIGNFEDPPFGSPRRRDKARTDYRKGAQRIAIRSFAEGDQYAALFQKARRLGVRICLIDLPRSSDAWELLPAGFQASLDGLIAQYEGAYGIFHQPFSALLDEEDFVDMAHLNARGRNRYSGWFIQQLPEMLTQ